jgi:hypothetical protein
MKGKGKTEMNILLFPTGWFDSFKLLALFRFSKEFKISLPGENPVLARPEHGQSFQNDFQVVM